MAADNDDIIEHAVVKVGPDLTGFRKKLQADLKAATKDVEATVKVKLVADGRGLKGSVQRAIKEQMALPNQPVYKVKVVADAKGLKRSVADASRTVTDAARRTENDVTREAEKGANQRSRIFDREAKRRKNLFDQLSGGPKIIDWGGEGIRPMNLLYGIVAAMTPALFAMSASAVQASTSIAALGSAGIGASLALGGLLVAFNGVGDVLKLRKTVMEQQTTADANATAATEQLASAKRALADALQGEKTAQDEVHKARQEAIRDLEDLRQAVKDLDNEYKSNKISVAEARQNAIATDRNYFATALDRARAWQDYRDAQTKLSDTALQRRQKKADLRESVSKGIEGSDKVRAAKERAADARDRRLNAQKAVNTARNAGKVTSAAANLKAKIADLAPAAQEMYYWFAKNEDLFKRLHKQIAQQVLPGFNDFLKAIIAKPKGGKSTLEIAAQYAGELGAIFGKYAGKLGEWMQSPLFRTSMARIQEHNAAAFDKLGQALLTLADPLMRILDKAAPGFEDLADAILNLTERFADWIEQLDKSGGLAAWFEESRREMAKWFDTAGNILGIVKNLLTAALPSGKSLMTSFQQFTQSLEDLTGSVAGQKWLSDFFEKVRTLPYGQIIDFFKNAAIFFYAFRMIKFLKGLNPLFTGLAAIAAANPQGTARLFATMADAISGVVGYLADHPQAAATLLGILAAVKLGKTIGFNIKIPIIDRLRDALVGKFKVLDKFIGGGATTAVMNVNANVVNVYGKLINGGGGLPDIDAGAGKGKAGKAGKFGSFAAGGFWTLIAVGLYEAIFGATGDKARRTTQEMTIQAIALAVNAISSRTLAERIKDPLGTTIADAVGIVAGLVNGGGTRQREQATFSRLQRDISDYGFQHGMRGNDPNVVRRTAVTAYIDARKKSVAALVEEIRTTQGDTAAKAANLVETRKSSAVLSEMLQKYGWTKQKADDYADAITGLNGLLVQQKQDAYLATGAVTKHGTSMRNAGKQAEEATPKITKLYEEIDKTTGNKVITFTTTGEDAVREDLEGLNAYQQLLKQGKPFTEANVRRQKAIFAKNLADGGTVGGHSPHDKADNIPAWLTANEYVQPVSAVKYYGTDFMDAIRTRRIPRLANGGQPDTWPFPVKAPPETADPGMGWAPYTGPIPTGVGALKGLTGKLAAAAIDLHRATGASISSGLRPGSITATGNRSYHGYGRAIDIVPPSMAVFHYLKNKYDGAIKELIYTPAGNKQVWNGRNHLYRDPRTMAQHFNHVHLALAGGGLAKKYDTGGTLPPGYTLAFNGTGQNETVRTARQEATLNNLRLDRRDITLLAHHMAQAVGQPAITLDGRRIVETTNRYNYLPAGV